MRAVEANSGAIQRARARIWTAIPPPQQIQPKSDRLLALRVFSTSRYRLFGLPGASDTVPGVRPADSQSGLGRFRVPAPDIGPALLVLKNQIHSGRRMLRLDQLTGEKAAGGLAEQQRQYALLSVCETTIGKAGAYFPIRGGSDPASGACISY